MTDSRDCLISNRESLKGNVSTLQSRTISMENPRKILVKLEVAQWSPESLCLFMDAWVAVILCAS